LSGFFCRRLLSQALGKITIAVTKTIKGRSSEFFGFSFFYE
jgi:hypothetical protein